MKKDGYCNAWDGVKVTNQPYDGIFTGHWMIDHHGCWHEYTGKDGVTYWMIGEYPEDYNE